MESQLFWQIALQVFLIGLNAIFACAEIAVISINKNKLSVLTSKGNKKALRLEKLIEQPARFLATIQVAITLSGFLGSAFAADNFSDILTEKLITLGVNVNVKVMDTISVIVITLILSYFTLVFGELVPKRIAMKKAEQMALGMATPISFVSKLFAPIVWLLTISTNGILRLMGIDPNEQNDDVSEEDICLMVDAGLQNGAIASEEKDFIRNIFEFDDITLDEFATHRKEVAILYAEDSQEEWEKIIHTARHTIYPVCEKTADNIIGILNIKDYFRLSDKSFENVKRCAITQPYFVPETLNADILFKKMKKSKSKFAVVLDEYGGFSGIVTMNDLIEQLVGDLDETDEELKKIDENTWEVLGNVSLKFVTQVLNIELPLDEYETFSGFVFGMYGSIPDDGSVFEVDTDDLHIQVLQIKEHRIEKAVITVNQIQTDLQNQL